MPDSLKYYTHTRTRMHTQNLSVYLYVDAIIFHVLQNKLHLGNSALRNPRSSGDAATAEEERQGGREQRSFPAVLPDLQPLRGGERTPPSKHRLEQGCEYVPSPLYWGL